MERTFLEEGEKKRRGEKEHCKNISCSCTQFSTDLHEQEPPQTKSLCILVSAVLFKSSFKSTLTVVQFIRAQFFNPLSTNLLFWAYWINLPHIFGLGCKNGPYNWRRLWEELVH